MTEQKPGEQWTQIVPEAPAVPDLFHQREMFRMEEMKPEAESIQLQYNGDTGISTKGKLYILVIAISLFVLLLAQCSPAATGTGGTI